MLWKGGGSIYDRNDSQSAMSIRLLVGGTVCKLPIAAGSNPQQPVECPAHDHDAAESSDCRHLFEPVTSAFELTARRLNARLKHELRRRRADLSRKDALEV